MSINWNQDQPAPTTLWKLIHSRFAETRNLGIYVKDADDHGEGRALDCGLLVSRPSENQIAWGLINEVLIPNREEIGWSYFIWDQWIFYAPPRGQQKGGFKGDHTNHIHISWSQATSQRTEFPRTTAALNSLMVKILGGVEDEKTLTSDVRLYSSVN